MIGQSNELRYYVYTNSEILSRDLNTWIKPFSADLRKGKRGGYF